MKAVILAGGLGTRLSEETTIRPKPMVEIGEMPILWHIMKIYSAHGVNDFVVLCGYKSHVIKEFFFQYSLRTSSVRFNLADNNVEFLEPRHEPWSVTLLDTGPETMTGGRLKRARTYLGREPFFMTYGDGLANVDIQALRQFHEQQGTLCTLTTVQPPGRFGAISLSATQNQIESFVEKPDGDGAWINGGYFVVDPAAIDLIEGDDTIWEQAPLEQLAAQGQLSAFRHRGFWHPMDTLHDRRKLEGFWASGQAPWKIWPD